jgi:hypothetical protein
VKKINAMPIFDVALFMSMCKQCQRLMTLYTESQNGSNKASEMFKTLMARSHYRFKESMGGFSQMISHVVLNQVEFCISIVPRKDFDDDDSSSDDEDEDEQKPKSRKNKKVKKKPKMLRFIFTPGSVYKSPDQSFHKNEVRLLYFLENKAASYVIMVLSPTQCLTL